MLYKVYVVKYVVGGVGGMNILLIYQRCLNQFNLVYGFNVKYCLYRKYLIRNKCYQKKKLFI